MTDVARIFSFVDLDGTGAVDYDEFVVACLNPLIFKRKKTLNELFQFLGPDKQT